MLSVKEVAEKLAISEHTIRYYTDQGLVPTVQRGPNNQRLFDQTSLDWLQGCHFLRLTGMSIADVKHYVDLCLEGETTIPERYQLIQKQKAKAQQQLEDTQERLKFLNHKEKIYGQLLSQKEHKDPLNPKTWTEDVNKNSAVK